MYSAIELKQLTIKPKINDISLEVLREFYEMFLYPFIYTYTITGKGPNKEVAIRFNAQNFCHLLGIETIAKKAIKNSELYNYRGEKGWNNIKNGVIDIKHLKILNKKKFLSVKAKYVYFYLIPSLLDNPLAVNYDKSKVMPPTNIHLGIEKEKDGKFYFPQTFFVEKLRTPSDKNIYIDEQEQIMVKKENRIITLEDTNAGWINVYRFFLPSEL